MGNQVSDTHPFYVPETARLRSGARKEAVPAAAAASCSTYEALLRSPQFYQEFFTNLDSEPLIRSLVEVDSEEDVRSLLANIRQYRTMDPAIVEEMEETHFKYKQALRAGVEVRTKRFFLPRLLMFYFFLFFFLLSILFSNFFSPLRVLSIAYYSPRPFSSALNVIFLYLSYISIRSLFRIVSISVTSNCKHYLRQREILS